MAEFKDTAFVYDQRNVIVVQTGDKEYFTVKYKGSAKETKFNTEGFNFVGVDGTYVAREQVEGSQYTLELYFDGENYLDDVRKFEKSSKNKNAWTVVHPIYKTITCQPLSIAVDDNALNMTKVTCVVWESITSKYPLEKEDIKSKVYEIKPYLYAESAWTSKLSAKSIDTAFKLNDLININYSALPNTIEQAVELKNKIREVSNFAQEMLDQPIRYLESLQALIEFPFIIATDINDKIKKLKAVFTDFFNIGDMTLFEPVSASIISAALSMSLNSKFSNRETVAFVYNDIKSMYDLSLQKMEDESYQQSPLMAQKMDYAYNYGLVNLYIVGMDSKQERNIILEADSNVIVLANRFYGISDENIDRFISENNITLQELIQVKKGRKILWYV
jgi:hypothetical protein